MAKKIICQVLAFILVLTFSVTALAEEKLNIMFVSATDTGYLKVTAATQYTKDADMSFSAETENGQLEISDSMVLRDEGTSWFVILEYNHYQNNEHYATTANAALQHIAGMVSDKDEGALVRCDKDHAIKLEQAGMFRSSLTKSHVRTDAAELVNTIKDVQSYITANYDKMMPNVTIIVITACPDAVISDQMIDDIGKTLEDNSTITTHIIVTAAESVNQKDRIKGQRLIDQAYKTIGGTGYMTERLSADPAKDAVNWINEIESRKILMVLDPVKSDALGHKLTIKQTTAGGKVLADTADLPNGLYTRWEEGLKARKGSGAGDGTENIIEPPKAIDSKPVQDPGSVYVGPVQKDYIQPKSEGLSTELLAAIIVGAVVLILLIALLIIRGSKNRKKQQSVSQIYGTPTASPAPSSGETTIILNGNNGAVLKGKMKNGRLTIGRNGAKAMISVPNDGKLSGLHATFTQNGGVMMLTDNNSTNGTKVNGNRINPSEPTQLHQNDTVTLGSTIYTVTWQR